MTKKLALSDFRAIRHQLEPHEFALDGEDVAPTNPIDEETWAGIIHRCPAPNTLYKSLTWGQAPVETVA